MRTSDSVPDIRIRVDRSVLPEYPPWATRILHKDVERSGPQTYYLSTMQLWLHPSQKARDSIVAGETIYDALKNEGIEKCLGLADLYAIRDKKVLVFRRSFGANVVFAWRGVVANDEGERLTPCLFEGEYGRLTLGWVGLSQFWGKDQPALRFPTCM